jgi:hypothetical protein
VLPEKVNGDNSVYPEALAFNTTEAVIAVLAMADDPVNGCR